MHLILRCYACLLFTVSLCGCVQTTTVHIYGKYLDSQQRAEIAKTFALATHYHIEVNELDFPLSITNNTLLYSPLLRQPSAINVVLDLSLATGFPIQQTQGLTQGNHWYTKDSLALFLFPSNSSNQRLLAPDLVNNYKATDCGAADSLALTKNGRFLLRMNNQALKGEWKYRQYPYVELHKDGSHYADYYFEIRQFTDTDRVSAINFLSLQLLNTDNTLPEHCFFIVGTRV